MTLPPPVTPAPTALRRLARGWRRRCPECGCAPMFVGWFTLAPRCASCGLSFERDEREDYWLGAAQMIVTPISRFATEAQPRSMSKPRPAAIPRAQRPRQTTVVTTTLIQA